MPDSATAPIGSCQCEGGGHLPATANAARGENPQGRDRINLWNQGWSA